LGVISITWMLNHISILLLSHHCKVWLGQMVVKWLELGNKNNF
jgi:hypothetical protein